MSFAPLEPQHVANIAWGLGKADWPAPKLMCAIVTAIITDCIPLASFQSIHLAQLAWAIAKARDGGDTTARPPAPASPPSQHTTAAVPNGSIAASSSPQQNSQHGPNSSASSSSEEGNSAFADLRLLKQISKVLAGRMASMGAAEMCMVAWSLAVVRRPSHSLYHSIAARARALLHAGQLSLSNQATLLWAYARQGLYIEWLFDALCTAVLPSMRACSTGSLSMIMWALAATTGLGDGRGSALVQRHAALAKEASLVLHAELHSFSGNEVSNLAWALAEIGHYEPQLWDAMAQYLLQPPTQTSSGAFKNHRQRLQEGPSLQAHAAQQRSPTSLAGEASVEQGKGGEGNSPLRASGPVRHGEPLLARMQAFELSKLVWAYAKVGHVDEHLFGEVSELLCAAASHLPHRFSKAKRSAAAAAAAVQMRTHAHLGIPMPSSQQAAIPGGAVAHEGTSKRVKPHALHAGTVSRAMWAFAMLGLHDDPVLPALMPHVRAVLPFTEPRDVSAVLWALASSGLGSEDDDLVVACMTRANANLNAFTLHQLAELLWAAATLQSQPGRTHGLPALVTPILAHTKRTLQEHLSSAGRRGPSRTHMGGLRLEDVATIMWALITFRHYDPKLVKQVARAVTPLLQHCLSHHQQRHQPTMADTAEPQPRLPAHGSSPMPLPSSSAELMTPSTTTPSTTNSSSMPVPSSGTVEEFSSPSTTSTSTTNSSNSGLHQVRPAPPPFPVPSADPEHVVSLLHSFATCSSYQPSLYHAAGQLLADQLDVLGMEQLVQVAWVYAAMLPACLTTSRYLNGQGNREAGSGRRGEPSHSRSRGNLSAPAAADGDRSVSDRDSHEGISSSQRRPYSTSSSLRSLELLDAHLNLLHEAQVMLSAAVPANRRVRLPPQELLLLWQAHEVCAAAAPEVTQLRATLVVHHDCYEGKSEDGSNRQVGSTSALASELHPSQQGLEAATPFMMATGLYNQAVQVCSMVPRKRRSRQQAEMVAALESLGFASLPPRLPALPSASPAEEVALAMAGPDFIAGKQV
uniref:Uncharacterized protein n=1 Tax=Dunaliella tertiolecta TaxID=3047 RepID=A0A7S3VTF2_DUNTE